jgi:hypothetical protein
MFSGYNIKMQFHYVGAVTQQAILSLGRKITFWKPRQAVTLVAAFPFFSSL